MKKRFLSALLAAAMITTMAVPVSAESKDAEDDPGISTVSSSDAIDPDQFVPKEYSSLNEADSDAAEINGTKYKTMEAAVEAANSGDTIKMLADDSVSTLKEGVTYDLNGKTLTCTAANGEITVSHEETSFIDTSVSNSECGGTLDFPNITFTGAAMTAAGAGAVLDLSNINFISNGSCVFVSGDAILNVTNCRFVSPTYCIGTNAGTIENYGVTINLENSSFTSESSDGDNTAICFNVGGTLNIDDCQLTSGRQALIVRAGSANISNSVITTNGIFNDKDRYHSGTWKTGNEVPAAALTVGNYSPGNASAYEADAIVTVTNTKLIAKNEFPALYVDGNTSYKADVTLSGAETAVTGEVLKGQQKAEGAVNISITGGVFSTDVADHCAPGYITEESNGVYIVKSGTNDTIAKVDAAIKDSASDDTINAAVAAVASTPNSELSDSSATMDKLTELEKVYNNICTDSNKITVTVEASTTEVPEVEVDKEAKNAALSAVPGDTIKINVAKSAAANVETVIKNAIQAETAPEVKALDITMTKNNEPTPIQPAAPVLLTFDMPDGWENAQIYRIESDTAAAIPTAINTDADGKKTIVGTFDHFSTYGIARLEATANQNEYEFILTPDKTDVSAGDTLTYTVKLKHVSGDNRNVGAFIFTPTIENSDLLEFDSTNSKASSDVKLSKNGDNYEFTYNNTNGINIGLGNTIDIGTLTYKVKDYTTDNTKVIVNGSGSDQVSTVKLQESVTPNVVTEKDVTYHAITVTFQQDDDTSTTLYAKYNESILYSDSAHNNKVSAPVLDLDTTGGTEYRVKDTNWYAGSAPDGLKYTESTAFKTSITYVPNKVDLVEIDIPESVTVDGSVDPVTERESKTFVDKGADLKFTVAKDDTVGEKYDVTVKVGDTAVTDNNITLVTNTDGTITGAVKGTAITDKVTFDIKSVLDLTAEDIGIFTTGENDTKAYVEYSKYSGSDTLVLIKGKAGANYTLNDGQPTIYANAAYGNGFTHAVLVPKQDMVSQQAMFDYLVNNGLKVSTTTNEAINSSSWDTNGNGNTNRDLGDYQAANDFKTFGPNEDWGWTPTDDLLMLADVVTLGTGGDKYADADYTVTRDGWVSDEDVNTFVYRYAHLG